MGQVEFKPHEARSTGWVEKTIINLSDWDIFSYDNIYLVLYKVTQTLQGNDRIPHATIYTFDNSADLNINNLTINKN